MRLRSRAGMRRLGRRLWRELPDRRPDGGLPLRQLQLLLSLRRPL